MVAQQDLDFDPKLMASALKALHNPRRLETHPLADRSLVTLYLQQHHLADTPAMRARALRDLLRTLVEELQPSLTVPQTDRSWLIYETMRQRFIQDHSPTTAALDLAASDRTMFRWQQAGIELVCENWRAREQAEAKRRETSQRGIPRLRNFVGRTEELRLLEAEARGEEKNAVMVVGAPGTGKTALLAELASSQLTQRLTLWVTARFGIMASADAIVEELALQLAALGQEDCLKAIRLAASRQPLSVTGKVAELLKALDNRYFVCVDNVERLASEPTTLALLEALWERAQQGQMRLALIGHEPLDFVRNPIRVDGFNRDDARRFIEAKDVRGLPDELYAVVYTMTQGMPLFLEALAGWVRQRKLDLGSVEGQRLFAQQLQTLDRIDAIERLLGRIFNNLDPQCRHFLTIASAFRRPFDELDENFIQLLEHADVSDVAKAVDTLRSLYVLTPLADGSLALHPLTRQYVYAQVRADPITRRRVHAAIAAYYGRRALDAEQGETAHHFYESGDYARSAQVLLDYIGGWIRSGQMSVVDTLARFGPDQLDTVLWAEVLRARGDVASAQGEMEEGVRNYLEASNLVEQEPPSCERHVHLGRLYHGLGRCYRLANQGVALEWYERAIAQLEPVATEALDAAQLLGAVYADGAGVLYQSGKYKTAMTWCKRALTFSRGLDPVLEAQVHNMRGNVFYSRGRLDAASTEYELALAKSQNTSPYHASMSLGNLSLVYIAEGRWLEARDYLERCLTIKADIGDTNGRALTLFNLASLLYKIGEDDAHVMSLLQTAMAIWQQNQAHYLLGAGYMNMGLVALTNGDLATARRYLNRSLKLYRRHARGVSLLPEICRWTGLLHARMGDMGTASRWLERSLRLGQKLGLQREVLMTIRVSGEVHRLAGEWETAYALLTQALADSTRLDQYEAGLAHMSLAELFVAASHPKGTESFLTLDEACDHLRQAVAIFEALPAKRELAKARLMAASVELPSRHAGQ